MALETSAESPVPVRTALQLIGGWITRLGRIWVEGQITELNRRAGTVPGSSHDVGTAGDGLDPGQPSPVRREPG